MNLLIGSSTQIKGVVFDLDGVFTNGLIYNFLNEDTLERFKGKTYNGKDSFALKILKKSGIKTAIITADTEDTLRGMKHIIERVDRIYCGEYNKMPALREIKDEWGFDWDEMAYMGDDLPDLRCMEKVGMSACPKDAVEEIQQVASYVCNKKGGKGAVREFVDWLLK